MISDRTRFLNQITSYLDQIFPEFKPLFDNGLNKSAFYLLTHYITPAKMSKLDSNKYSKMKSELKSPISYQKVCQIKDAAKNTIGHSSKALEYALKSALNIYLYLDNQIEELEIKIIEGIGILTAAGIISEISNITKFITSAQLQAYAGLEPSKIQFGTMENNGKMVNHGSKYSQFSQKKLKKSKISKTLPL